MSKVKIVAGRATSKLAAKIAEKYGQELVNTKVSVFKDGEFQPVYNETLRGCEVFIIQSTFPPADNLMELLLLIDAAKRSSAHRVIAVMPYFGLARQDRKDKPRVPIGAKLVANLLTAAGVDRIITMDLHADQIQGFFDVTVDHLFASSLFLPHIRSLNIENLCIASPDTGGTRRAGSYAKKLHAELAIGYKQRLRENKVASLQIIGDVKNKNVILVDDIIDTAGTICKAASVIKKAGAKTVRAMCVHPVLSGDAYKVIEKSDLEEVIVTDTIPLKKKSNKITVLSTASLFAKVITSVTEYSSINDLFEIETGERVN